MAADHAPPESALSRHVRDALVAGGYARRGARVLVGVSGGPDSTALLAGLVDVRDECGLELRAVHIDHGLRAESRGDAAYVRRLCARWGVPVTVQRVDVQGLRREEGLSVEEAARRARHHAMLNEADAHKADTIALGHTKDDQIETALLNLLRGAGLRGLAGMAEHGDSPFTLPNGGRVPIIRPLLGVTRGQVMRYLRGKRLRPRHDASNADPAHLRNRVRHELLPLMEQIRESATDALARASTDARTALNYVESQAKPVWQTACVPAPDGQSVRINRDVLREAHIALRHVVLERCITTLLDSSQGVSRRNYVDMDAMIIMGRTGSQIDLPKGLRLACLTKHEAMLCVSGRAEQREGSQPADIRENSTRQGSIES